MSSNNFNDVVVFTRKPKGGLTKLVLETQEPSTPLLPIAQQSPLQTANSIKGVTKQGSFLLGIQNLQTPKIGPTDPRADFIEKKRTMRFGGSTPQAQLLNP